MPYEIPSLDDSHEFTLALYLALLDDPNLNQGSFWWLWGKTQAGAVTDNHAHIAAVENDILPDTASDDVTPANPTSMLSRWGNMLNVPKKGATPASGNVALRVFGTIGATVPDASQLVTAGLLTFQTVGTQTVTSLGYVDCNILGIDTGTQTNLDVNTSLTFTAAPTGIQDAATIVIALTNGTDIEPTGAYRLRVLSQIAVPAPPAYGAGKQNDYVQAALGQTGIAAAFCYPNRQGLGSVDVAALHAGTGNERLLLSGEVTALQAALDSLIPVELSADAGSFRVLTVFATGNFIEYTFVPDGTAASEFDWDDSPGFTVSAWDATTRTLTPSSLPPDLAAGMRINIVHPDAIPDVSGQIVVAAISGSTLILESAPSFAPTAGDTIYAGGNLVDPVTAAIQAIVDGLGPANPDAIRYGAWEGNLDPGAIDASARTVAGVLRGNVVAPAALVEASDPAYPNDATIELLIAPSILVHEAH